MINVPHNDGQDWEAFRAKAREKIIQKVNTVLQTDISPLIETEDYLDPILIEQRTSSDKGSLYGSSSNDRMSAFFRQANFTSSYKNLYFCGGSVHPGGGIPLCLLGANILNKIIPDAED
jgi:phytoene dehydrogenase-like protein